MFTILLSILFTICTLAAAAPPLRVPSTQSVPWNKFKEDQSLARFQSTLLNETMLSFLDECYTNQVLKTKEIPCSLYFDAILQLNSTDFVVQTPIVLKLLKQNDTFGDFCASNQSFPHKKYFQTTGKDLKDPAACGRLCLDVDFNPIPICRFLAWLGEEIKTSTSTSIKNIKVAPAVVAPVVNPQGVIAPSIVHPTLNNSSSNQTIASVIKPEKTPDIIKEATEEKPEQVPSNIQPIHTPPNIPAQLPTANASLVNPQTDKNDILPKAIPASDDEPKVLPHETNEEIIPPNTSNEDKKFEKSNPSIHDEVPGEMPPLNTGDKPNDEDQFNTELEEDTNEDNDDQLEQTQKKNIPVGKFEPGQESSQENTHEINFSSDITKKTNTDPFLEESGSNFFTYFLIGMFLSIALYVLYHNKSKVLALLLEGRRGDKSRGGRRKHTAAYRKLDSNLEEAITSSASGRTTQIIY